MNAVCRHRKKGAGVFWGIVFIVIGTVIVLNVFLGLHLPVFRTLLGVLLIYWGVKILTGPWRYEGSPDWGINARGRILFSSQEVAPKDVSELEDQQFSVVFGSGELNLVESQFPAGTTTIEVNTVFGESTVIIPRTLALETRVNSVAGSVELPAEAENGAAGGAAQKLKLVLNTIFGSSRVLRR